jgi:hypothetical protein
MVDLCFLYTILVLLYADDTIVMEENPVELEKALDAIHSYCVKYKFKVNISKQKWLFYLEAKLGVVVCYNSYLSYKSYIPAGI